MRRVTLLAILATTGCADAAVGFTRVSTPPVNVELTSTSTRIPVGIALAVDARILRDDEELTGDVTLTSRDQSIVEVRRSSGSNQNPSFVIYGVKEGITVIDVTVYSDPPFMHQSHSTITATVTEPAPG